jgi:hypothetical protein
VRGIISAFALVFSTCPPPNLPRTRLTTRQFLGELEVRQLLPPSYRFPPLREGNRAEVRFPLPAGFPYCVREPERLGSPCLQGEPKGEGEGSGGILSKGEGSGGILLCDLLPCQPFPFVGREPDCLPYSTTSTSSAVTRATPGAGCSIVARTCCSMAESSSGFSSRKARAFSRPCPKRVSPKLNHVPDF